MPESIPKHLNNYSKKSEHASHPLNSNSLKRLWHYYTIGNSAMIKEWRASVGNDGCHLICITLNKRCAQRITFSDAVISNLK